MIRKCLGILDLILDVLLDRLRHNNIGQRKRAYAARAKQTMYCYEKKLQYNIFPCV